MLEDNTSVTLRRTVLGGLSIGSIMLAGCMGDDPEETPPSDDDDGADDDENDGEEGDEEESIPDYQSLGVDQLDGDFLIDGQAKVLNVTPLDNVDDGWLDWYPDDVAFVYRINEDVGVYERVAEYLDEYGREGSIRTWTDTFGERRSYAVFLMQMVVPSDTETDLSITDANVDVDDEVFNVDFESSEDDRRESVSDGASVLTFEAFYEFDREQYPINEDSYDGTTRFSNSDREGIEILTSGPHAPRE